MKKNQINHVACSFAIVALSVQLGGCAMPTDEHTAVAEQADTSGLLAAAQDFVNHVQDTPGVVDSPDLNAYGSPSSINWTNYTGTTQGATLFTLSLQHSDSTLTSSVLRTWWGSSSPSSAAYYALINSQNHFTLINNINSVLPGDFISISYTDVGSTSGHSMIVETAPSALAIDINPIVSGSTQFSVGVIDSTSNGHGLDDSRYVSGAPNSTDPGAGRGTIRLYADASGNITGYAWSMSTSSVFYAQGGIRPHAIGRYFK